MREICHLQAGQCGNQIGAKVIYYHHIERLNLDTLSKILSDREILL
jgi:hypothetical protein